MATKPTKSSTASCACGKGSAHSLRDGGQCDGMRRYGRDYKTPKELKEAKRLAAAKRRLQEDQQ